MPYICLEKLYIKTAIYIHLEEKWNLVNKTLKQ